MSKKMTKEEFVEKARAIHGDKYNYSKVIYNSNKNKVTLICSIHGEFLQTPSDHLSGKGCAKCAGNFKLTREEFVEKAKQIHIDKYDYSKVIYDGNRKNIIIICKKHGEFEQIPSSHMRGHGCPKCANIETALRCNFTKEIFIKKARKIHGDKYDYSKVIYKKGSEKVIITCSTHGDFEQKPYYHLSGMGCRKCYYDIISKRSKSTTEEFVEKARKIHDDKYDYSKVIYDGNRKNIIIICKNHGEFEQKPHEHLTGYGCIKCGKEQASLKIICDFGEEFVEKARKIHGDKYDYSKTIYYGASKTLTIVCKKHGNFIQQPNNHLSGAGCPKCGREQIILKRQYDLEEFIQKANKIHNIKYNYSKSDYINSQTKLIIICPIHGEFEQKPNSHLRGIGCPSCNESKGEKFISVLLNKNNIKYQREKKFKILGQKRFDFYLPEYNLCIEYHGEHHYYPIDFTGRGKEWAKKEFEHNQKRDIKKKQFCQDNNINFLEIPYYKTDEEINQMIENKIKEISEKLENMG